MWVDGVVTWSGQNYCSADYNNPKMLSCVVSKLPHTHTLFLYIGVSQSASKPPDSSSRPGFRMEIAHRNSLHFSACSWMNNAHRKCLLYAITQEHYLRKSISYALLYRGKVLGSVLLWAAKQSWFFSCCHTNVVPLCCSVLTAWEREIYCYPTSNHAKV